MTQYTELLAQVHTLIPLCPNNDQIIDQIVLVTLGMQFVKNVLQLKKLNGPLNLQHIQYVGFQVSRCCMLHLQHIGVRCCIFFPYTQRAASILV